MDFLLIAIFAMAWLFLPAVVGLTVGNMTMAVVWALGVTLLASFLLKKPVYKGLHPTPMLALAGVALILVGGGLPAMGLTLDKFSGGSAQTSTAQPVIQQPPSTGAVLVGSADCQVTEELKGKSVTLTFNAWDMEANNPYSAAIDVNPTQLFKVNPDGTETWLATLTDTSAATSTAAGVGDTVTFYGGSSSYYLDNGILDRSSGRVTKRTFCLRSQQESVDLSAHATAVTNQVAMELFDSTGAAELTSGAVSSSESNTYDLAMGAGQTETVWVRIKVNTSNVAHDHAGFAAALLYNATDVRPGSLQSGNTYATQIEGLPSGASSAYTKVSAPLYMKNIAIQVNSTDETQARDYSPFIRGSDSVLTPDDTVRLHEFDSIKVRFQVETGANDNPDDQGGNGATANGFALCSFDATWHLGADGKAHYNFEDDTQSEGNVGVTERFAAAFGTAGQGTQCVIVNFT